MLHAGPTVCQRGVKGRFDMTIRLGRLGIRAVRNPWGEGQPEETQAMGGIGRPVKRSAHGEEAGFPTGGA